MSKIVNEAHQNSILRLNEVYKHLQTATAEYFNPENFRIALNACIQSIRNVTFILQKNKTKIENFDLWYSEWREALIQDPIMAWCVSARNRIVKQGDLETYSIARVHILTSYDAQASYVFNVNPLLDSDSIATFIREEKLPKDFNKYGYISVERQWICSDIKSMELLSLLSHAFTVLSALINDINEKKGSNTIYTSEHIVEDDQYLNISKKIRNSKKPDCLKMLNFPRISNMKLSNGAIVEYERTPINITKFNEEDNKRYDFSNLKALDKTPKLSKKVNFLLQAGKLILEKDGYHNPVIFLFDENGKCTINRTIFNDNEDKYLFWKQVAHEVRNFNYQSVIVISDTWVSKFNKESPDSRAEDDPNRTEALQAAGIERNGDSILITIPYIRVEGKIVYEENQFEENIKIGFLEPIRRAWE